MDKSKKIGFAVIGYGGMGSWMRRPARTISKTRLNS